MRRGAITKLPSPELKRSLEKAAKQYQMDLVNSSEGLSYLNGRGLGTFEAETYHLGFVENPIEGHEPFKGMISIPYLRPSGIVAMKFRRLTEDKPKYLNVPGCGTHLFNTEALRISGRTVGVCEGEFDAICLSGLVGIPAIGVPGATQWKGNRHWAALFEGKQVLIFPDIDAGQEGRPGEKLAEEIADTLAEARIVKLPDPDEEDGWKMDVNRCLLRYGRDEIRKRAGV